MARRNVLIPRSLESLLVRLEELVLANSGEDDFEEIFKLLLAKLWDEKRGSGEFGEGKTGDERHRVVNRLLAEAAVAWPGVLPDAGSRLTPQHLSTCAEILAPYRLSDSGLEVLDAAFEFLISSASKGSKGQYFTPRYVVDFCVSMVKPTRDERVIDPACGSGAFLLHSMLRLVDSGAIRPDELRQYAEAKLWGFDFDSRAVRIAKAMMLMAGDGSANFARVNSLVRENMSLFSADATGNAAHPFITIDDVCRSRMRGDKSFDVVLTNPPFAGEVREPEILESYRLGRGKKRVERDVLFIERCVELLRPGGRMAIVLPHNKFAGSAFADVRDWLRKSTRIVAVVGLGRNTFLPHTHQKANVLFAEKRVHYGVPDEPERIFFAVAEQDGKDGQGSLLLRESASGQVEMPTWRDVAHDLGDIVIAFDAFRKQERVFGVA